MTGRRDIERTLDAWFVDGPTVMPDRLFDAVLDQVERTHQHPLARLRLRLTEMNPRIRWLTAAAAALAAVVVAMTLINRPTGPNVGATPSPNPSASNDVPQGLEGTWHGANKAVPGVDDGAGLALWFRLTQFWITQANRADERLFQSELQAVGEATFELEIVSQAGGCALGDRGSYRWTLSPSGRTLTIEEDTPDACTVRGDAVVGTWWLEDCKDPNSEAACLGALDAADYASEYFDPYAADLETWKARFGALRYTVPAGWANAADWPSTFSLLPRREYDTYDASTCGEICPDAITLLANASAAEQGDTCESRAEPGVGRTADELVAWLTSLPGLDTSTEAVTVDGQAATAIDMAVSASWTGTCVANPPLVGLPLLTEVGGWHWAIFTGDRYRVIPVDLGDGDAVVVLVDTRDASTFDAFIAESKPIIESLDFTR